MATGTQFQMKADIIDMAEGGQAAPHVRVVMQYGPLAMIIVLPPDAMEQVCAQFDDVRARLIAEARRMAAMSGFQIVSGDALPKLPPMNGSGRRGEGL